MSYLFHRELHPDQKEDLKKLRNHLISSSSELAALKVWELQGQFLTSTNNTDQLWFNYSFSFLSREIFSPPYSFLQKADRGLWIWQCKYMYLALSTIPPTKIDYFSSAKESKRFIASIEARSCWEIKIDCFKIRVWSCFCQF